MTILETNDKAPDFCLEDKDSQTLCLSDVNTRFTLVYFYPEDNTPGCAMEANGFQALKDEFDKRDVSIIGISGGDASSKKSFCEKNDLDITLLSDTDFSVSTEFGAIDNMTREEQASKSINRMSFLLDTDKNIIKIYRNVTPESHPQEVVDDIDELTS
ncbi:MAG: peroxiredoxin [Nanoarchaeota archaeon]